MSSGAPIKARAAATLLLANAQACGCSIFYQRLFDAETFKKLSSRSYHTPLPSALFLRRSEKLKGKTTLSITDPYGSRLNI